MSRVNHLDIAEELIRGEWGFDNTSIDVKIKTSSWDQLSMCLLIDIAKSLRVLRCSNFQAIPCRLENILTEIGGLRRDLRKHRPKGCRRKS